MEQVVYIGIMMEKPLVVRQYGIYGKHKTREFRLHRGGQLQIYLDTKVAQLLNCELIIVEFDV